MQVRKVPIYEQFHNNYVHWLFRWLVIFLSILLSGSFPEIWTYISTTRWDSVVQTIRFWLESSCGISRNHFIFSRYHLIMYGDITRRLWMNVMYLVAPMHGSKRVTVLSVNQLRIRYQVFYLRNNQYTQHGNLATYVVFVVNSKIYQIRHYFCKV